MVESRERRVSAALVALCAALAYAGSLANGFTFDDLGIVLGNPVVQQGRWVDAATGDYWSPASGGPSGLYRPLSVVSLVVDHRIFGDRAWGYHLVNMLLHAANSALLVRLAGGALAPTASLAAGLVWALQPALTEAVNSAVGRCELLAGFLGLAALLAWRRGWTGDGRRAGLLAAGWVALLLSPLAKENGMSFAAALFGWGLLHHRRQLLAWAGPLAAGAAAAGLKLLAIGQWRPQAIGFIDNPLAYVDGATRAANGALLLLRYLRLLAFPWPLSADYSYDAIPVLRGGSTAVGWVVLGTLAAALFLMAGRARRSEEVAIWAGLAAASLAMVANLAVPSGTIFAERLAYTPAMGWCVGVGWAVGRLPRRILPWLGAAWMATAGALVWSRTADWRDDVRLFARAAEVCPRSARTHYGVGRALQERGDCAGALDAYDRALGVYPRYADAHYNRGAALICLDRQAEALQAYRQAAASRPGFAKALFAVAVLVEHLEGPAAAEAAYRQLLAVDPGHPEGSRALAAILTAQGRADAADGVAARARDQRSEAPDRGRGPAGRAAPTPP